jgi:hypothetical protein
MQVGNRARLAFLSTAPTCEDLPLLRGTPAALTQFDSRMGHPIDTDDSALDYHSTVRTGAGKRHIRPTLLG